MIDKENGICRREYHMIGLIVARSKNYVIGKREKFHLSFKKVA